MTIEERLERLKTEEYTGTVDVVDRVMAHVEQHPYLQPSHRRTNTTRWRIGATAAAAAVAAVVVVGVATNNSRGYDEEDMSNMIAQLNDYSTWNSIEEMAENPLEYIYEE